MRLSWQKLILLLIFAGLVTLFFYFDLRRYLTLEQLQASRLQLQESYQEHFWSMIVGYVLAYILMAALSLPGAVILTLAGGAVFGPWLGTLLVSIGSTVGATASFLSSRYLIGQTIQEKFGDKLETINRGIREEGAFYLLSLRLIPAFPFFLVNLLMGLTTIPVRTYFFMSQLGMLPGTFVYVYAGTQLSQIQTLRDIASTRLLLAFAAIGVLPILTKKLVQWWKNRKALKES